VLDGNGYVPALPRIDQWVSIHTVHSATNTETLSTGVSLRAVEPAMAKVVASAKEELARLVLQSLGLG